VPVRVRNALFAVLLALVAVLPNAGSATAVDGTAQPWIWPTSGNITQPFGCTGFWAEPPRGSCAHFHTGIDIANDRGTPIRAVADGTIELVGWDPWIHNNPDWMVIIDHGNGIKTMYAHMRAKAVDGITKGAHVFQGQLIGLMDMTGHATGPHLHFAVYLNGEPVNPRNYLTGPIPGPAGSAGPSGCLPDEPANGVGAGLDGRTAMVPGDQPRNVCSA
jgi:murein DD-endopeptidase MepM/ murein hydrolase activator NlpD